MKFLFTHPHTYAAACIVLGRAAFCMTLDRLRNYVSSSNRGLLGRGLLRSVTMNWITRLALTLQGRRFQRGESPGLAFVYGFMSSSTWFFLTFSSLLRWKTHQSQLAFFYGWGRYCRGSGGSAALPASWLTLPPFDGADVIHIQLQSWHGNQDACRLFTSKWREKKHTFFSFLFFCGKEKILSKKFCKAQSKAVLRVCNNVKNMLQNESLDDCVARVMQWCCCYINTCFI